MSQASLISKATGGSQLWGRSNGAFEMEGQTLKLPSHPCNWTSTAVSLTVLTSEPPRAS